MSQTDRGTDGMVTQTDRDAVFARAARAVLLSSGINADHGYGLVLMRTYANAIRESLADYEAAIKRETAQRCAEIADHFSEYLCANGIRHQFGLDGKEQSR